MVMDLMQLGTQLLMSKLGADADGDGNPDGVIGALSNLLGGSDGQLDLSSVISKMNECGLANIVGSWLGDGANDIISTDQIRNVLGSDKIAEFASKLDLCEDQAAESLADAVPQMIDRGSNGGSLLDSIGGLSGAVDMAKKFF
jgi:uncharacterized protein YidB (DUF937 family)